MKGWLGISIWVGLDGFDEELIVNILENVTDVWV
jgi:hypothetical protein